MPTDEPVPVGDEPEYVTPPGSTPAHRVALAEARRLVAPAADPAVRAAYADRAASEEAARQAEYLRQHGLQNDEAARENAKAVIEATYSMAMDEVSGVNERVEEYVYGQGDRSPGALAGIIEKLYGTYEQQPGWFSADEFMSARRQYEDEQGAASAGSRFLMAPDQFDYMQDVGRQVDLLRNLTEPYMSPASEYASWAGLPINGQPDPMARLEHFRESAGKRLARSDYNSPNYNRFSSWKSSGGDSTGYTDFLSSPTSPLGRYLSIGQHMLANPIKYGSEGNAPYASTAALNAYQTRYQLGPVTVLDIPSTQDVQVEDGGQTRPENDEERRARWAKELGAVARMGQDLQAPMPRDYYRNVTGTAGTPLLHNLLDIGTSVLDPSLAAAGAGKLPMYFVKNLRPATGVLGGLRATTGAGGRALRKEMAAYADDLFLPAAPGRRQLATAAQVAANRGVTAGDFLDAALKPMGVRSLLAKDAVDELAPELAIEPPVAYALSPAERTYEQFAFGEPQPPTDEQHEADRAQRQAMREAAQARMHSRATHYGPNVFWDERSTWLQR